MNTPGTPSFNRQLARSVEEKPMKVVDCPEISKIDPRIRRTRKLIEDAFQALLSEKPYAEISVADITSRATVNRGTFYSHFEDKEHLATTIMREGLEAVLRARLSHGMMMNPENLSSVAEAAFEFVGDIASGCVCEIDDDLANALMATLQETIQSLLWKWLDLDPEAIYRFPGASRDDVAGTLAWSIYGGALRWSRLSRRPPASEASRRIVAILMR